MEEFRINDYITLKLEPLIPDEGFLGSLVGYVARRLLDFPNKATNIYVNGEIFHQCKYLLLNVPKKETNLFDNVKSIDEASDILNNRLEFELNDPDISPDTEFWAHCSNLQAWTENNYDTRLIHRNLAFPLLRKLAEAGDPTARRVFKDEIAKRFASGHLPVIKYLLNENYLRFLDNEEIELILEDFRKNGIDHVIYQEKKVQIVNKNELDLSKSGISDLSKIEGLLKLKDLKILNLSGNYIEEIKGLESLINLERLNLSFNKIKEIKNLNNLIKLEHLYLHGNMIREIKGLEKLVNLQKLKLLLNPIKWRELYLLILSSKEVVKFCQKKKLL